jgi:hypothetical protein
MSGWSHSHVGSLLCTLVVCDILDQGINRIDRILIQLRYTFFFESPTAKNSGVKRVWPEAISGWVTDLKVFLGAHK